MNRSTKIFLATLVVVLGVVAFWFLRPIKRIAPQAAPLVHVTAPATAAEPVDAPVAALQSEGGAGQPAKSAPQPVAPAVIVSTPVLGSPAATPPAEPRAQPSAAQTPSTRPQTPTDEIAATARMYAAHASLRTPEVADPDSATNKQILQTMVLKSLSQPASLPPASLQVKSAK